MRELCPKSIRMLINYYHRELMSTNDLAARELYVNLLRHLERQLANAEKQDMEVMAYSS
jgi:hypothetical protein